MVQNENNQTEVTNNISQPAAEINNNNTPTSNNYDKKNNFFTKHKLLIGGVSAGILTILFLAIIFAPYLDIAKAPDLSTGKKIEDSFTSSEELINVLKVETGSAVPDYTMYFNNISNATEVYEIKYYKNKKEINIEDITIEIEGVRLLKGTGTYEIKLISEQKTLNSNLQVNDTQKPTVVLKTINTEYATKYNPKDFVNQYDDNSREYVFNVKVKDENQLIIRESGQHSVLIEVCDLSNNCTEKRATIIVGDKKLAITSTEEKKITVKTENLKYGVKKNTYVKAVFNVYKDGSTEEVSRGLEEVEIDQSGYNGTAKTMKKEMLENYAGYESARTNILNKTNEYRIANGLPALTLDDNLSEVASLRAMEIAYSGKLDHIRPNQKDWTTMWEEYNEKERNIVMAENIAGGYETDLEACEGWHASKSHNAIMMEERFTKIGIGKYSFNGQTYWVQHFAE